MSKLKPDQAAAAHTLDRHVSVTAGPGSGKTTVLIERYLHILRERDVSVDQIVAITFTNRAANEMRTRLRRELDRLMREAKPEKRAKWLSHKRTLDGAIITTFHGFCSRLLREFPIEAAIDPQFTLFDETQSAMLIEGVVEETLTEFINSGHEAITRLVVANGRARVGEAAVKIYRTMRGHGLSLPQIEESTRASHSNSEEYSRLFEAADALMREFIGRDDLAKGAEEKRKRAAELWPSTRETVATIPSLDFLAAYCNAIEELRGSARPTASGKIKEIVARLDEMLWGSEKLDPFGCLPKICFDHHARAFALEMIGVVRLIDQRLEEEKSKIASLDFDDLLIRVLRLLDDRPEVLNRIASRYRFFLVDEFQDTNNQQRELMQRLGLASSQRANLFIVGDRKQSIYGFRGADVDVFRAMTADIEATEGLSQPLSTNFRSQRPLIEFFNHLFASAFIPSADSTAEELNQLGYVEHEHSRAHRVAESESPIVELLIDIRDDRSDRGETLTNDTSRSRDAKQIAERILSLVEGENRIQFRDIALLFRAMPNVAEYESVFRRVGIPYSTVQGKGFYTREEITDIFQLLRFLDNTTDETALAALLRSPFCGLSDDALLALRCAPVLDNSSELATLERRNGARNLLNALSDFENISFINEDERSALGRARQLLSNLIASRNRLGIAELLRLSIEASEFRTVVAANFDGAQRLTNVEKMFELAERFEKSGAHLIRDFVRFVEDFEEAGGREAEGQLDEAADAVHLMTIHQSKGLEFPVVFIPDLTRELKRRNSDWFIIDRQRGLTVKVPDGRGGTVGGNALEKFRERAFSRDVFESMRLFYVAATRAEDRLILAGASVKKLDFAGKTENWLKWVMTSLGLNNNFTTGVLAIGEDISVSVVENLADALDVRATSAEAGLVNVDTPLETTEPFENRFGLMKPLEPERIPFLDEAGEVPGTRERNIALRRALHRFSVTQLLNFQHCPRQYFFDRILRTPPLDDLGRGNSAEVPETDMALSPTVRGAVIHRFCEIYESAIDVWACLRICLDHVLGQRSEELNDREQAAAIREMLPLAQNYLKSDVFKRIETARGSLSANGDSRVFNERSFLIRRPLGTLRGTIDKMIVTADRESGGVNTEIIDFKTNRFSKKGSIESHLRFEVAKTAIDYQLQMQAYALAAHELIPNLNRLRVTLHFLDPNIEHALSASDSAPEEVKMALDTAMESLLSSAPDSYPTRPSEHCRFCSFREICTDGQRWFVNRTAIV